MGATIIGAGILAGASLAGTAATVATNSSNQSYGAGESAAAREWSTNERLAAQQYNTSERLAAQQYNTSERLATQEYNSLPNQVMQARAAGLNPQVFGHSVSFQGASPMSSQGASSSQPSAGLSGIGTSQVPNIPQLISSGADLVNALAKHKETEASLPLINEQVKNYMLQNFGQETTNKILDLEKQLKEATLPAEIKKKFEELAKLGFDKLVSEQQVKKFEQETKLLKQQEEINNIVKGLKGQELIQAQYLTQRWNEIQDSVIALNKAKAGEANASAALKNEQINTEKSIQGLNDVLTELRGIERDSAKDMSPVKLRQEIAKLDAIQTATILEKLRAEDMAAYSAFQRILTGHSQEGDVTKIINAIHNIDNVSLALPKLTK